MTLDEWLKKRHACGPAKELIEERGWWGALYGGEADRDDWWLWGLSHLETDTPSRRLVGQRLRTETTRLIRVSRKNGRLAKAALTRLNNPDRRLRHPPPGWWCPRQRSLETALREMQWYSRPAAATFMFDHNVWWMLRFSRPVEAELTSRQQNAEVCRKMFPRPVVERLLELNGIEAPK